MKNEDLRYKILELLPIDQQDIWKSLGLEHRQVSKIVLKLQKEGFLTRTAGHGTYSLFLTVEGVHEGRRLYLLRKKSVAVKKPAPVKVPAKKPVGVKKLAPAVSKLAPVKILAEKKKKENRFAPLLSSDGLFSPCTGCSKYAECDPGTCVPLTKWAA